MIDYMPVAMVKPLKNADWGAEGVGYRYFGMGAVRFNCALFLFPVCAEGQ